MVTHKIDWKSLSFQDFQKLCLHLAQSVFRDCNFEEFLREGNHQEGIDILSVNQKGGKFITIQCKRVEVFSRSKAEAAVKEFEQNYFVNEASVFILAVSCPVSEPAKKYLLREAKILAAKFSVKLLLWDSSFLSEQLRKQYTLVSFFFSPAVADEHCFTPTNLPKTTQFQKISPFIPRFVTPFLRVDESISRWRNVPKESVQSLSSLLIKNRLVSKQICLIADAYQGKTYLLRQTAFELQNSPIPFFPLLIELKFQVMQPLDQILDQFYGTWKAVPAQDMILLIDGMDEVPNDKFYDMLLHIKNFNHSYPYITVIFSCRKLFFELHRVEKILVNFSIYELYTLSETDVGDFIQKRLHNQAKEFENLVATSELQNFLYHPFYLINLIETFRTSKKSLPKSKIGVVEQFIDKAYSAENDRRVSGGKALKDRRIVYRQAVQKLGLALQLAGRNAISEEELQLLFAEKELDLLQHNSLITASSEQWSFSNALFQEHLAALALSKMDFDTIISFISIGKKVKKVRTKWIQTVASLISLLDVTDVRYTQLLNFLEDDNIELLFTTEKTKYSEAQRVEMLKKLLQRCQSKNIRLVTISEARVSTFIDGDRNGVSELIHQFKQGEQSAVITTLICDILYDLNSMLGLESEFLIKAIHALTIEESPYTAGSIVQVLARFNLGDHLTAEHLIHNPHSNNHYYRKAVYEYLIAVKKVDQYYHYGIDGMQVLLEHNRGITHAGSEFWFNQFLLSTTNAHHLSILISKLTESTWVEYFDRHGMQEDKFFFQVCELAGKHFKDNGKIVISIAELLKNMDHHQNNVAYQSITDFFNKTDSHSLAIRVLVDDILLKRRPELAALIRESNLDYMLWEWEERGSAIQDLRLWLFGLRLYGQNDIAQKIHHILTQVSEGKLDEREVSEYEIWLSNEQKRRDNDLQYFQSLELFKEGVRVFFQQYGKSEIPENEIFIDYEMRPAWKTFHSNLIPRFLRKCIVKHEKLALSKALNILNNPENFEQFCVQEIVEYKFQGDEKELCLKEIAKEYFDKYLVELNFTNSIWQTPGKISWWRKQVLVGDVFNRFQFDTTPSNLFKLVWLDQGGIRNFETADLNNKQTISQKILSKLSEEDLLLFREKICNNIQLGISSDGVLGNHIGLCKHLKIFESSGILANLILSSNDDRFSRSDLLDIYLELGGELSVLLPQFKEFKDFNSYYYFHFISKFMQDFPKQVYDSLLECMNSEFVTQETKIRAAQNLCSLGDFNGFKYLAGELRKNYRAPYSIQPFSKITTLNTSDVLTEIEDLAFLLLDPIGSSEHDFSGAARNILIEWLQIFAQKSEVDLYKVIEFYENAYRKLQGSYSNAYNLYWFEEQVIEKFRGTNQTLLKIHQIAPILQRMEFKN